MQLHLSSELLTQRTNKFESTGIRKIAAKKYAAVVLESRSTHQSALMTSNMYFGLKVVALCTAVSCRRTQ